ncbi:hypothetical protein DAEQUDRAFT_252615 [Daedalea quercina L-15889]|uniref:Uncharacterized protein n=1 Tax=Daedalea quercina L-15889 TaxID=1314783 RepID=A0A165QPE0_9APHY|nr:hypothetical protein DAEQUDRAFT_252615 [Daedalea quercina L-15889]
MCPRRVVSFNMYRLHHCHPVLVLESPPCHQLRLVLLAMLLCLHVCLLIAPDASLIFDLRQFIPFDINLLFRTRLHQ